MTKSEWAQLGAVGLGLAALLQRSLIFSETLLIFESMTPGFKKQWMVQYIYSFIQTTCSQQIDGIIGMSDSEEV